MDPTQCGKAGVVAPKINRNKCEGKKDCQVVCPYSVFEIRKLDDSDRLQLSFIGKMKAWAHGYMQAYVVDPLLCHACGLCVKACPEKAITLVKI